MRYHVRPATLDDVDVLVRHRVAMFSDMSVPLDEASLAPAFARWLRATMPPGTYRAWLVEMADDGHRGPARPHDGSPSGAARVVAGGGATILPWPPGPRYMGDKLAFVYNMYVEPPYRRRGLARLVMQAIHDWCRAAGVSSVALNASRDGQPLYEALGYAVVPSPMMILGLGEPAASELA
jgi:GNAT superfamily N-acetyltransferase